MPPVLTPASINDLGGGGGGGQLQTPWLSSINAAGHALHNLLDPTSAQDAATEAYVLAVRDALVNAAPGSLDTLKKLADAIGDDAAFATTVAAALATKQPLDAELSALATIVGAAANKLPYFTGANSATVTDFTAAGRTLIGEANTAAMRAFLGVSSGGLTYLDPAFLDPLYTAKLESQRWEERFDFGGYVSTLAVSRLDPDLVLFGCDVSTPRISFDGGYTVHHRGLAIQPFGQNKVFALACDPTLKHRMYFAVGSGSYLNSALYVSDDFGITKTRLDDPNDHFVYFGGNIPGPKTSAGVSWTGVTNTITDTNATADYIGRVLGGTNAGLNNRVVAVAGTTVTLSGNTAGSSSGTYTFTFPLPSNNPRSYSPNALIPYDDGTNNRILFTLTSNNGVWRIVFDSTTLVVGSRTKLNISAGTVARCPRGMAYMQGHPNDPGGSDNLLIGIVDTGDPQHMIRVNNATGSFIETQPAASPTNVEEVVSCRVHGPPALNCAFAVGAEFVKGTNQASAANPTWTDMTTVIPVGGIAPDKNGDGTPLYSAVDAFEVQDTMNNKVCVVIGCVYPNDFAASTAQVKSFANFYRGFIDFTNIAVNTDFTTVWTRCGSQHLDLNNNQVLGHPHWTTNGGQNNLPLIAAGVVGAIRHIPGRCQRIIAACRGAAVACDNILAPSPIFYVLGGNGAALISSYADHFSQVGVGFFGTSDSELGIQTLYGCKTRNLGFFESLTSTYPTTNRGSKAIHVDKWTGVVYVAFGTGGASNNGFDIFRGSAPGSRDTPFAYTDEAACPYGKAFTALNLNTGHGAHVNVGLCIAAAVIHDGTDAIVLAATKEPGFFWSKDESTWTQLGPTGAGGLFTAIHGEAQGSPAQVDKNRGIAYFLDRTNGVWRIKVVPGSGVPSAAELISKFAIPSTPTGDTCGFLRIDEAHDRLWVSTDVGVYHIDNASTVAGGAAGVVGTEVFAANGQTGSPGPFKTLIDGTMLLALNGESSAGALLTPKFLKVADPLTFASPVDLADDDYRGAVVYPRVVEASADEIYASAIGYGTGRHSKRLK